jgi:hypothetical protein
MQKAAANIGDRLPCTASIIPMEPFLEPTILPVLTDYE